MKTTIQPTFTPFGTNSSAMVRAAWEDISVLTILPDPLQEEGHNGPAWWVMVYLAACNFLDTDAETPAIPASKLQTVENVARSNERVRCIIEVAISQRIKPIMENAAAAESLQWSLFRAMKLIDGSNGQHVATLAGKLNFAGALGKDITSILDRRRTQLTEYLIGWFHQQVTQTVERESIELDDTPLILAVRQGTEGKEKTTLKSKVARLNAIFGTDLRLPTPQS